MVAMEFGPRLRVLWKRAMDACGFAGAFAFAFCAEILRFEIEIFNFGGIDAGDNIGRQNIAFRQIMSPFDFTPFSSSSKDDDKN